jgi:glycosyltransferase involved in cell wall biosynthesis
MRVSAIVATYNCGHWLRECIDSILSQDPPVMELIIVDDGSTDDTPRIVAALADRQIRYFRQDNTGQPSALNAGIANARGDILAFLDADDLWPPNYLRQMLEGLSHAPQYGLAYCALTHIHPDGNTESMPPEVYPTGRVTSEMFQRFLVWVQGSVVRKACMEGMWFDERLRTGQDADLLLRLSLRTPFLFVPGVRVIRRIRPDSLSQHPDNYRMNMVRGIRVYERFYYRLGGKECIPPRLARGYLSRTCLRHARKYRVSGARRAAITLYRHAIRYNPLSHRAYLGLLRAWIMPQGRDTIAQWEMPEQLPADIYRLPGPRAVEIADPSTAVLQNG